MKVKDAMTRGVRIIPAECSIREAAQHMKKYNIGTVAIGDVHNVIGVVTDRDITIRATAEGLDAAHASVRDIMTPSPYHAFEEQDIEDACLFMQEKHVRRLIILNWEREPVGLLSLDDVAGKARKRDLAGFVLSKMEDRN